VTLINQNNQNFTLHAIGIGSGVSTSLIVEASAAGKGEHYFVDDKAEGL